MYYRRLYLSFVVSLLLLLPFIFTGCDNNAGAQNNGPVIATEFIPAIGFPFVARKDDGSGEFETGSFNIDTFLLEDGNLAARGLLKGAFFDPVGTEVILPVDITAATCSSLEMQIGPPSGLLDPIVVATQKNAIGNLGPSDFCGISMANASGDNDELVSLLNEEDTPLLGGCPWYDDLKCAGADFFCSAGMCNQIMDCKACFQALGDSDCIKCFDLPD